MTKRQRADEMASIYSPFRTPSAEARYLAAYDRVLSAWPVNFQSVEIATPFGQTHAIVSGPPDGRPMVMLHGNFASATMWQPNVADLTGPFRVYALDTIGNPGRSRAVCPPQTRREYAEWLTAVLVQLNLTAATLVGQSYGAFLAFNLAIQSPQLVSRLVMLSPDLPLVPMSSAGLLASVAMTVIPSRWTVGRFLRQISVKGYPANDPYYEQRIIGNTGVRSLKHLRPQLTEIELRSLKARTLALWGEKEILWNPKLAMARAKALWPGVEADILPGCGHALNRDDPRGVNTRIIEFAGT